MKKIGIGYEFYKEFIDDNMYYVDKTLLIRDVLEKGGKVTLFTRPRRFGKTLALTTLQTFFELEYDRERKVIDKRRYFEGMKIMGAGEEVLSKMGQYPVIFLSLKSAKQTMFSAAVLSLFEEIRYEFDRHSYLLDSNALSEDEKTSIKKVLGWRGIWQSKTDALKTQKEYEEAAWKECGDFSGSLKLLSQCLEKHHGRKTIILLDEYDVPLENAYFTGFYQEMVGFIRSLFESTLKTNPALEFAVVTGCLRISKESIFTGLNHLKIISVRSEDFTEGFGFTQEETEQMLIDYGLREKVEEVRDWYDGYLFGKTEIYNPWSVISYVDTCSVNPERFPEPYWSNTSSNSIIKELVYTSGDETKKELESLIDGGAIEKRIHEDITYDDIHQDEDNLWNFLFFTGYMRRVSEQIAGRDNYMTMRIPNREIESIYARQISEWFEGKVKKTDPASLYRAVENRDPDGIGDFLTQLLEQCISTFDSAESFYHGFLLSLLYGFPRYSVRSNRESGNGRPDIILYPNRPKDPAYVFELKSRKKFSEMDAGLKEALDQIRDNNYAGGILDEGYIGSVSIGICFCRKSCIAGVL